MLDVTKKSPSFDHSEPPDVVIHNTRAPNTRSKVGGSLTPFDTPNLSTDTSPSAKRSRYGRRKNKVTKAERTNVLDAISHAEKIGMPITHALTIELDRLAGESSSYLTAKEPAVALPSFIRAIGKWFDRHSLERVHIWARENTPAGGEHIHFGLHLPKHRSAKLINWLERHLNADQGARLRRPHLKGLIANSSGGGWLLQWNYRGLEGALHWGRYITKGIEGDQGVTSGKRLGMTNNINRNARISAGARQFHVCGAR